MSESFAERLQKEFCPPLDSSLVAAILLDYAEEPPDEVQEQLRDDLGKLAAEAAADELEVPPEVASVGVSRTNSGHDTSLGSSTNEELEDLLDQLSFDNDASSSTPATSYDDTPLGFLATVFPRLSRDDLESKLSEGNGDVETIVEVLLNEDLIARERDDWIYADQYGSASEHRRDESSETPMSRKERKAAKAAAKASHTLALNDVLHRAPPPQSKRAPPSPRPESDSAPATPSGGARPRPIFPAHDEPNRWVTLDSTAMYLARLMRIPAGRFTSAYHRSDASLPLAVEQLLTDLAHERPYEDIRAGEEYMLQLAGLLDHRRSEDEMRRLLSATQGDVSDALALSRKLQDIEREHGSLLANGYFGLGAEDTSRRVALVSDRSTLRPIVPTQVARPTHEGWRKVQSRKRLGEVDADPSGVQQPVRLPRRDEMEANDDAGLATRYSSAECMALAQDYLERRNERYLMAAKHWQRGRGGTSGEQGAAWHYSEEGRELDRRRRLWEERAAFALVNERKVKASAVNSIDLHHLTVQQALRVTKESCNAWLSSPAYPQTPLRIIIGIGRHSAGNAPVLKPAVTKFLDRNGWRWKWDGVGDNNQGALRVTGFA